MKRILYIIKEVILTTIACMGGWVVTKLEDVNIKKILKRMIGIIILSTIFPVFTSIINPNGSFIELFFDTMIWEIKEIGVVVMLFTLIWSLGGFEDDDNDYIY